MDPSTLAKLIPWAEWALLAIVLLPLGGAVANGVGWLQKEKPSRALVRAIGLGTVGAAFLLSVFAFFVLWSHRRLPGYEDARIVNDLYQWFSLSIGGAQVPVRVAFALDPLSAVMLFFITGIGFLIHLYSVEYMADDEGFARFFAYLNLFMASMLILVLASSLPLMFVGWEGVGLCSYLLIGFWFKTPAYAAAGRKAFVMNRIGDFGVLIGTFILFTATASFEFHEIAERAGALQVPLYFGRAELGMIATVAGLFLFLGCAGKSAQIPLYTWLPDAMAGPTPVSALIHAATMVTSGVYLCCRLSDVFVLSHTAMATIAIVGALTALLAASIALVQNQLKKILAYSTVSQLGFMFAAVGSGAFAAGIFHVFTHAFFKACLFLGAGAIMHAVHAHGDADIRKLGGLRRHLPTVHWTFLVSCMAIAGVPLLSGWFSKDEVLLGALGSGAYFTAGFGESGAYVPWIVTAILVVAATMTAFYMFRMYFLTFHGAYRSAPAPAGVGEGHEPHVPAASHDADHGHGYAPHPHVPGLPIRAALSILGVGAVIAGVVNLEPLLHLFGGHGGNLWGSWLAGTVAAVEGELHGLSAYLPVIGGFLAMAVGVGLAYVMYLRQGRMPRTESAGLHRALMNKWWVDELYAAVVVRPFRATAVFSGSVDKYVVDGLLAKATALAVQALSFLFTRLQSGTVYAYGAVMVVGIAALGWWFAFPHPRLEGAAEEARVSWSAGRGLGYEYRWDIDSDGLFEHEWDAARHSLVAGYAPDDWVGFALVLAGDRFAAERELVLSDEDEELVLRERDLGRDWQTDPEAGSTPPAFFVREGKVFMRPNDANARVGGVASEGEVELAPGDTVQIGMTSLRVAAVVRATVEVRNAFGSVRPQTRDVVIRPAAGSPAQAALLPGGRP